MSNSSSQGCGFCISTRSSFLYSERTSPFMDSPCRARRSPKHKELAEDLTRADTISLDRVIINDISVMSAAQHLGIVQFKTALHNPVAPLFGIKLFRNNAGAVTN